MKTTKLIFFILSVFFLATISSVYAQTEQVSEECLQNISLFGTACKHKNFADAVAPWEKVYADCPKAHVNIYIQGVQIVNWQIGQTKDPAEKMALFNKMMTLFDQRIELFTGGSKAKKAQILSIKGQYYMRYKPQDKATVYPWFKEVVQTLGEKSGLVPLQYFVVTSSELYKADSTLGEQFINDYLLANTHLEAIISNPGAKTPEKYSELKNTLDALFVISGAADCDVLNRIYADQIEKNKENLEYLLRTMKFFKGLRCTEETSYFAAAQYAYAIEPNAESAIGLGNMSFGKGDIDEAISYFEDAANLFEADLDKADAYLRIAQCYYKQNKVVKVRDYCKKSLALNSAQGAPYMMLGMIYADAGSISEDPLLNKAKYWVAVDQFRKARNAEPDNENLKSAANKMISTYRPYFPSKEDVFMKPEFNPAGKSYHVGSWINETTTTRSK